jgi:hypothetical protein
MMLPGARAPPPAWTRKRPARPRESAAPLQTTFVTPEEPALQARAPALQSVHRIIGEPEDLDGRSAVGERAMSKLFQDKAGLQVKFRYRFSESLT